MVSLISLLLKCTLNGDEDHDRKFIADAGNGQASLAKYSKQPAMECDNLAA